MSLLLTQLSGGTAHTKNLSDTITLSDAISKAPGLGKTDTAALSDAVAKAVGKLQSDTITLSDATARSVVVARADTLTLTEANTKAVGKQQTDTITLSDFESHISGTGHTKSLSDTITLTDAISVVVPPQPPFPPVFLGGGGTEIGHPRMKALKPERREDDNEELEIVAILTCWLGKN